MKQERTSCILLSLVFSSVLAGSVFAGEKLYNGIVLPDEWPPQRTVEVLWTLEPMPVPYLKNPPSVIPMDIGRQLFVDDFLIEQTTLEKKVLQSRDLQKQSCS